MANPQRKNSADELVPLIFGLIRTIHTHLNKQHRQDINFFSPLQVHALGYIKDKKSPLMKEVADFLCITPPSATSLINNLVKANLLVRHENPKDRRVVHLHLTAKGERLFKTGFKQMAAHMREVFLCLNEQERKQMVSIYKKIYKHLNRTKNHEELY